MTRRSALALGLVAAVAGCDRYGVPDEGVLATRLTQDFQIGTPARDLVAALTGAGFRLRGPVRSTPGALPDCLTRRATGPFTPMGAKSIHVCFAADGRGMLRAVEVSATRSTT